jgi:hypothetical protein
MKQSLRHFSPITCSNINIHIARQSNDHMFNIKICDVLCIRDAEIFFRFVGKNIYILNIKHNVYVPSHVLKLGQLSYKYLKKL